MLPLKLQDLSPERMFWNNEAFGVITGSLPIANSITILYNNFDFNTTERLNVATE